MFNKYSSDASLNYSNRGQFVEQHSWTYVAQKLILKPNQNNYDFDHTFLYYFIKAGVE